MSTLSSKKLGALLLVFCLPSLFADTLFLKDGSEVKGDIIHSGTDGIVIEYYVTATIKDQKNFSNDEVLKVVTVAEDEKAFQALGSMQPPPTVLDTSFYDSLLDEKIPDFLKKYPYSSHVPELRAERADLNAERERVASGDRRLDGIWFTASQLAANPFQTGARIQLTLLRKLAGGEDPVAALKCYELLEKKYPGSAALPDAIEVARTQLDRLQVKLYTVQVNYPILLKKREAWLASSPPEQVKEIRAALDNEATKANETILTATKDGSKFFPVYPNVKEALEQLQTLIVSERERLKLFQIPAMRDSLACTSSAARLISVGNLKEAQVKLDAAVKLWPANAEIDQLRQKIEAVLKKNGMVPAPAH